MVLCYLVCAICCVLYTICIASILVPAKILPFQPSSPLPTISILICAKNAEKHILKNLPIWLERVSKTIPILLINHHSTDNSRSILNSFQEQFPNFKWYPAIHAPQFQGKREALISAIPYIQTESIFLTDIDCIPSNNWAIHSYQQALQSADYVSGPALFEQPKTWVQTAIYIDQIHIQIQNWAAQKIKFPLTLTGRNWALHTKLFTQEAIEYSNTSISGDDDALALNLKAQAYKHQFIPNTHTISDLEKNFNTQINRRKRHLQTATIYPFKHKLVFLLFAILRTAPSLTLLFGILILDFRFILVFALYFYILYVILHKLNIKIGVFALLITDFCMSLFTPFWNVFSIWKATLYGTKHKS